MRMLNDFRCLECGETEERFHDSDEGFLRCTLCGGKSQRMPPRTQHIENFGALGVHHTRGRRLSPTERERREHWNRTRFGDQAPADAVPKPKVFA